MFSRSGFGKQHQKNIGTGYNPKILYFSIVSLRSVFINIHFLWIDIFDEIEVLLLLVS